MFSASGQCTVRLLYDYSGHYKQLAFTIPSADAGFVRKHT